MLGPGANCRQGRHGRRANPAALARSATSWPPQLKPWIEPLGYAGYVVMDRQRSILVGYDRRQPGRPTLVADYLEFAKHGARRARPPSRGRFRRCPLLPDEWGGMSVGVPTMFAAAPVRDDDGPGRGRAGFSHPARPGVHRDPQRRPASARPARPTPSTKRADALAQPLRGSVEGDRPAGRSAKKSRSRADRRAARSGRRHDRAASGPTAAPQRTAADATWRPSAIARQEPGVNVEGYRDYRGVPVVGAWTWLPRLRLRRGHRNRQGRGLSAGVHPARRCFGRCSACWPPLALALLAFTLLGRSAGAAGARGRDRRRQARPVRARRKDRRGRHGRGVSRRGTRMLRRPTAIKLLEPDKTTELSDRPLRARGAADQPAQPSQHDHDLRLRPHRRGRVLLRHGVSRRLLAAVAGRAISARSPTAA